MGETALLVTELIKNGKKSNILCLTVTMSTEDKCVK